MQRSNSLPYYIHLLFANFVRILGAEDVREIFDVNFSQILEHYVSLA